MSSPTASAVQPVTQEVADRYRSNYGLAEQSVSAEQVAFHLDLEKRLTQELLVSTPANRWDVFERAYSDLYEQLPWLVDTGGEVDVARWSKLIGPAPRRVYEVGSGHGDLARALAEAGYVVTATDVSRERGGDRGRVARLTWAVTDGVNLAEHAAAASFDAVISDQLIEHLHPDDVAKHFSGARALLRPGGRYAFRTPHALTGPHDVSLVVEAAKPFGMHLKEYTCGELESVARAAGFSDVRSVATVSGLAPFTRASRTHLAYQRLIERTASLHRPRAKRALRAAKYPVRPDVWLVASV